MNLMLALAVCLIGALVYVLIQPVDLPSKVKEMGRLAFACGLLAFLLTFSGVISIATR